MYLDRNGVTRHWPAFLLGIGFGQPAYWGIGPPPRWASGFALGHWPASLLGIGFGPCAPCWALALAHLLTGALARLLAGHWLWPNCLLGPWPASLLCTGFWPTCLLGHWPASLLGIGFGPLACWFIGPPLCWALALAHVLTGALACLLAGHWLWPICSLLGIGFGPPAYWGIGPPPCWAVALAHLLTGALARLLAGHWILPTCLRGIGPPPYWALAHPFTGSAPYHWPTTLKFWLSGFRVWVLAPGFWLQAGSGVF